MSLFHLSQGAKGGHYKNKIKKLTPKLMLENYRLAWACIRFFKQSDLFIINKADLNEQAEKL